MKLSTETITPEFAQQLLDGGGNNRPRSEAAVQRYAADMKAGRWNNNGQGLIFTEDMVLLDGQHRLAAVIASGTPTEFNITVGVDPETFVTMDTGKHRSMSDVLAIEGFKNTVTFASICRTSYGYISGLTINNEFTRGTLEGFARKHPYAQEVAAMLENSSAGRHIPKGVIGGVLFLANEQHGLDAEVSGFLKGVLRGEGLFRGDPRMTIREWIAASRASRATMRREVVFAGVTRAWNAYATGKEITTLRGLDDATIRGLPIYGFQRSNYPDVPDLYEAYLELRAETARKASEKGRKMQAAMRERRATAKAAEVTAKASAPPARGSIGRSAKA